MCVREQEAFRLGEIITLLDEILRDISPSSTVFARLVTVRDDVNFIIDSRGLE